MATPIERQLFNSAGAYYLGATLLMKPLPQETTASHLLVQPAVTCAALSLKLYLKCLLALEGKDKEDSIYQIVELYRALSNDTEKLILQKFDEFSNTALSSDELLKHLEALDNAFVRWRYIHEEDAKSVNLADLDEMILAVKATINSLRPDWE